MIPVVFSNPKNKKFAKVLVIFFLLFVGGNLFFAPSARAGADAISSINSIAVESPALYDGGTIGKCQVMLNIAKAVPCLPAGVTLNCKEHDDAIGVAGAQCTKDATDDAQKKQVLALIAEAKTKDKAREVLAFAFKSALKTFSRQVAHDTAVWVASGGKGQQPLFITEGWGAYLQNTADSALGQFIDGIGTQYGVNLCQPDFRVKLMIQTALNYKQVQKSTSCSFSKIMTNWEGAISSASFAVDYRNAMRPGANDISFMIQMADERNSYVGDAVNVATKKAETTGLWKDITNVAGKILTPGTVVANTFRDKTADSNTTLGLSTFTNTAADMVEEFGNTLVSQLLSGLQTGLFASTNSGGSTGANSNPLGLNASDAVDTLVNLFNYNSSPVVSGAAGAENKFANLITSKEKVGNKYDVLLKLASCSDSAKLNPNVTDCVIDNSFSEQIKKMTYVKDLPSDSNGTNILGRAFAPIISQTNSLETEIPYRSILILRKYRIVPVGWEIAANKIHNNEVTTTAGVSAKRWTLGEVMNCYYGQGINNCNTDAFKGLVNPNWLLKVYEAFCRREGFGAHNSAGNNQTGDIARDTYCADEQQCLADDSKGNCKAYGYCSEERALWDVGNSCQAAYNTCQTYSGRSGTAGSLLKNSLDFSNCSNLNVGCQALTTNFNLAGAIWNGEFLNEAKDLQLYALSSGAQVLTVGGDASWKVKQYHNASVNNRLKITQTCTPELCSGVDSKCNWEASTKTCNFNKSGNTCTTAPSAVSCLVEACYEQGNVIGGTGFNNGFEESATAGDARYWSDELAYFNLSNRAYRATDQKHSGNASLHTVASNNPVELVTKLENVPLDKNNANYSLKFWAKGSVTAGLLKINVLSGSDDLAGISYTLAGSLGDWKEYVLQFSSKGHSTSTIAITTVAASIADVYFDDFRIQKMTAACQNSVSIMLFTGTVNAPNKTNSSNLYLDRDAATCSAQDDGCSLFLRNKANTGGNLIYNGGFEHGLTGWNSAWIANATGGATIPAASLFNKSVAVDSNDYYNLAYDVARADANVAAQTNLNLYFVTEASSDNHLAIAASDTNCVASGVNSLNLNAAPSSADLERVSCWFKIPAGGKVLKFTVGGVNGSVNVDSFKLEKVSLSNLSGTAYSAYDPSLRLANQVSYLKKAPDYFNCYKTLGGKWPETISELTSVLQNRNEMCSTYSGVCTKKEVGCEAYTPASGDPLVPGVVDNLDLCGSECVGYQVFKQESTYFATSTFKQFIADSKVKYCSAADAGCDEFTNLDVIGQGAEVKEYFSELRACQKPAADDAAYYTWEGSDTTGYQLKSYTLKKSNISTAACTNLKYFDSSNVKAGQNYCDDASSAAICSQDQMITNPDCRELYDVNGNIAYRLLSKTVTVAADCHPYRRTQTQATVAQAQADCIESHGYFNKNSECVYMSISTEARSCSAAAKGCRAYTGNQGNNVRNVIDVQDFAAGTSTDDAWFDMRNPLGKTGLKISTEATFPGGNSLSNALASDNIQRKVTLTKNKTYILSFWAKGDQSYYASSIKFSDAPASDYFTYSRVVGDNLLGGRVQITNNWRYYELGPVFVSWDPAVDEYLVFNLGGQKIYLDNVILKEISNKVYLIDNSWYTPISCDNRMDDADGKKAIASGTCQDSSSGRCSIGEMVGCQAYSDRFKNPWYLRSFSSLCREEAVGCEALVDTHNSEAPEATTVNAGTDVNGYDADVVTVPADETVYMVNRAEFSCQASAKGCTAVGLPLIDRWDQTLGYSTLFLKNDPDTYDTSMCKHEEQWCEQYTTNDSTTYFKDPHGKVCAYGRPNATLAEGWYVSGTEEKCATTTNLTLGTGYEPAVKKSQPVGPVDNVTMAINPSYDGWAGTCPTAQSGCSEYVDPLPYIYTNQVLSSACQVNGQATSSCSKVKLKANTLYSYSVVGGLNFTPIAGSCASQPLTSETVDGQTFALLGGKVSGSYFYINEPNKTDCFYNLATKNGHVFDFNEDTRAGGDKITIAGVYYATKNSVNKSECAGVVDFNKGCVLFNERDGLDYSVLPNTSATVAKRFYDYLTYRAPDTFALNMQLSGAQNAVNPSLSNGSEGDSNAILKVKPNRTCSNWLTCTTYEKAQANDNNPFFSVNDRCLQVKACDYVDDNGQCGDFVDNASSTMITADNVSRFAGATGFAGANLKYYDMMKQNGESSSVVNGNFENGYNGTAEPIGWSGAYYKCADLSNCTGDPTESGLTWIPNNYSLSNLGNIAHEGSNYLKLNAGNAVISEPVELNSNNSYYVSLWVNTQNLNGQADGRTGDKPRAEVQLKFTSLQGAPITNTGIVELLSADGTRSTSIDPNDNGGWIFDNSLRLASGQQWTQLKYRIKVLNQSVNLSFALMNMNPDAEKNYDNTKLGGYSAWDEIEVKPVLNAGTDNEVNRSCRVYPTANAQACSYNDNNTNYYGQYGYCLLNDPSNAQQCLQWWPVDTIKGEMLSDFNGYYKERYPLYYCLAKAKSNPIDLNTAMANLGKFGQGGASSGYTTDNFSDLGSIQAVAFSPDNAWAPMFRYPFVYRFDFLGGIFGIGSTGSHKPIVGVLNATMYPKMVCPGIASLAQLIFGVDPANGFLCYREIAPSSNTVTTTNDTCDDSDPQCANKKEGLNWVEEHVIQPVKNLIISALKDIAGSLNLNQDDEWGGWGSVGTMVDVAGLIAVVHLELPWHTVMGFQESFIGKLASTAISLIGGLAQAVPVVGDLAHLFVMYGGMKIVTDQDLQYASRFTDPDPNRPGDVLGFVHYWDIGGAQGFGDKTGGAALGGNVSAKISPEYCTDIVQVVNSSGQNRAWAARLSSGSGYTGAGSDCVTDSLIAGTQCFYQSTYCLSSINNCKDSAGKDWKGNCDNLIGCPDSNAVVDPGDDNRILLCSGQNVNSVNKANGSGSRLAANYFCDSSNGYPAIFSKIYAYNGYNYLTTDYKPYGSVVAPITSQNPSNWDTRPGTSGKQPLYYETPFGSTAPYQARMGQVYTVDNLKALFAKSYGHWIWSNKDSGYQKVDSGLWSVPTEYCEDRNPSFSYRSSTNENIYCKIRPKFPISPSSTPSVVSNIGSIKFVFVVDVDANQLPLKSFEVNWGDGDKTSYAGVSLLNRPDQKNPLTLYHSYSYYSLIKNLPACSGAVSENCNDGTNVFKMRPNVKVIDNWNADNTAASVNFISVNGPQ